MNAGALLIKSLPSRDFGKAMTSRILVTSHMMAHSRSKPATNQDGRHIIAYNGSLSKFHDKTWEFKDNVKSFGNSQNEIFRVDGGRGLGLKSHFRVQFVIEFCLSCVKFSEISLHYIVGGEKS